MTRRLLLNLVTSLCCSHDAGRVSWGSRSGVSLLKKKKKNANAKGDLRNGDAKEQIRFPERYGPAVVPYTTDRPSRSPSFLNRAAPPVPAPSEGAGKVAGALTSNWPVAAFPWKNSESSFPVLHVSVKGLIKALRKVVEGKSDSERGRVACWWLLKNLEGVPMMKYATQDASEDLYRKTPVCTDYAALVAPVAADQTYIWRPEPKMTAATVRALEAPKGGFFTLDEKSDAQRPGLQRFHSLMFDTCCQEPWSGKDVKRERYPKKPAPHEIPGEWMLTDWDVTRSFTTSDVTLLTPRKGNFFSVRGIDLTKPPASRHRFPTSFSPIAWMKDHWTAALSRTAERAPPAGSRAKEPSPSWIGSHMCRQVVGHFAGLAKLMSVYELKKDGRYEIKKGGPPLRPPKQGDADATEEERREFVKSLVKAHCEPMCATFASGTLMVGVDERSAYDKHNKTLYTNGLLDADEGFGKKHTYDWRPSPPDLSQKEGQDIVDALWQLTMKEDQAYQNSVSRNISKQRLKVLHQHLFETCCEKSEEAKPREQTCRVEQEKAELKTYLHKMSFWHEDEDWTRGPGFWTEDEVYNGTRSGDADDVDEKEAGAEVVGEVAGKNSGGKKKKLRNAAKSLPNEDEDDGDPGGCGGGGGGCR